MSFDKKMAHLSVEKDVVQLTMALWKMNVVYQKMSHEKTCRTIKIVSYAVWRYEWFTKRNKTWLDKGDQNSQKTKNIKSRILRKKKYLILVSADFDFAQNRIHKQRVWVRKAREFFNNMKVWKKKKNPESINFLSPRTKNLRERFKAKKTQIFRMIRNGKKKNYREKIERESKLRDGVEIYLL